MRVILITLGVSIFVGTFLLYVSGTFSTQVQMLRWLDNANAEITFQNDLRSKRLRFFVVYGITTFIPSVGKINHERCYKGIELTTIEGTSDAYQSPEHRRLTELAYKFAKSYNLLMKAYIDRQRDYSCEQE